MTAPLEQLESLLPAADVALDDEVIDRIDALVGPGETVGRAGYSYAPPGAASSRRASVPQLAAVGLPRRRMGTGSETAEWTLRVE
jgi:aryl-alcohol dehydrogenase (NADP+)